MKRNTVVRRNIFRSGNTRSGAIFRVLWMAAAVALLPLFLVGLLLLTLSVAWKTRNNDISITAYVPLAVRWILHETGRREDRAARDILMGIPGVSPVIVRMTLIPLLGAIRSTGMDFAPLAYPVRRSVSPLQMINHRTTFFDEQIRRYRSKVEQVIVLGSGWCSRPSRLSADRDLQVFEVDRAEMLAAKQAALDSAGMEVSEITFVNSDLNRDCWFESLKQTDFDPEKPTLVMAEGVLPYLDPEAIRDRILPETRRLEKGSAMVFDYLGKNATEKSLSQRVAGWFGEPWNWGFDTDPPVRRNLSSFLSVHGLKVADHDVHGRETGQSKTYGGLVLAVPE